MPPSHPAAVDHRKESERLLKQAADAPNIAANEAAEKIWIPTAQVHATLAQVEQLEALNEKLDGLVSGGTDKYWKVRNG